MLGGLKALYLQAGMTDEQFEKTIRKYPIELLATGALMGGDWSVVNALAPGVGNMKDGGLDESQLEAELVGIPQPLGTEYVYEDDLMTDQIGQEAGGREGLEERYTL